MLIFGVQRGGFGVELCVGGDERKGKALRSPNMPIQRL